MGGFICHVSVSWSILVEAIFDETPSLLQFASSCLSRMHLFLLWWHICCCDFLNIVMWRFFSIISVDLLQRLCHKMLSCWLVMVELVSVYHFQLLSQEYHLFRHRRRFIVVENKILGIVCLLIFVMCIVHNFFIITTLTLTKTLTPQQLNIIEHHLKDFVCCCWLFVMYPV